MKRAQSDRAALAERFLRVRTITEALCAPLTPEDCAAQSMPDASPAKWHLAHTSWFFETFVLSRTRAHEPFRRGFAELYNSYYDAAGPRIARAGRGLITRPGFDEVRAYRAYVTGRVLALLEDDVDAELLSVLELGVNHEEQHQELLVTDIKHLLSSNPLKPAMRAPIAREPSVGSPLAFRPFDAGVRVIGHAGSDFAFDNERPSHREFVEAYALADRLVTNAEYLEFIRDGGYTRPELWLSDGFRVASERGFTAPLYWESSHDRVFTLHGLSALEPNDPVCHVSYYEADAFARWAGARLATEAEWEASARELPIRGNFAESGAFEPRPAEAGEPALRQLFGDVWEWTASAYAPYPGFRPLAGALGEYNGKFMANQMVLRGGSCATPVEHVRATYRNFFPPDARWQFTGIRLARSA